MRQLLAPALFIIAADQLCKQVIRTAIPANGFLPLLGDQIGLTNIINTGSAFGLLDGQNAILIIVALAMIVALVAWRKDLAPWKGGDVLVSMIIGGIVGNLIDRLYIGGVVDYLKLGPWPAFNVADATLTIGIIGLVVISFIEDRKKHA
jgi:signal peptidase II